MVGARLGQAHLGEGWGTVKLRTFNFLGQAWGKVGGWLRHGWGKLPAILIAESLYAQVLLDGMIIVSKNCF